MHGWEYEPAARENSAELKQKRKRYPKTHTNHLPEKKQTYVATKLHTHT